MAWQLVVFASLNQAALLRRALHRKGVSVELQRTPQSLSATGCSYALRCTEQEVPPLLEQAQALSIRHGGIFAETGAELASQKRTFDLNELEQ